MIAAIDICGFCGLDPEQIDAIAEHEHIPEVAAAALASYLMHQAHGLEHVRDMIVDDIKAAFKQGRKRHAAELVMALRNLFEHFPEVRPGLG